MKVLAIDPGFGRCGVAILEKINGKEHLIFSECIETSAKTPFAERLSQVADSCTKLIKKHKPDAVALERLFFNSNQKTALQVAEVRGAVIHVASSARVPVFEYTPGQVKSATTGWGRSDKKSIATMIHALMKIEKDIRHDDEYDAIAVGITHLAHTR